MKLKRKNRIKVDMILAFCKTAYAKHQMDLITSKYDKRCLIKFNDRHWFRSQPKINFIFKKLIKFL
jgi:hypothetical protein